MRLEGGSSTARERFKREPSLPFCDTPIGLQIKLFGKSSRLRKRGRGGEGAENLNLKSHNGGHTREPQEGAKERPAESRGGHPARPWTASARSRKARGKTQQDHGRSQVTRFVSD